MAQISSAGAELARDNGSPAQTCSRSDAISGLHQPYAVRVHLRIPTRGTSHGAFRRPLLQAKSRLNVAIQT